MIKGVQLKNFGPLSSFSWDDLRGINLVIGPNGCGKTFLLKMLYATMKTLETHNRGDELRSAKEILAEKLHWTFQGDKIGDLVSKGSSGKLECRVSFVQSHLYFSYGPDARKEIASLEYGIQKREENSVFLPAKEVLSLRKPILYSRENEMLFGFDDTYYDLAKILGIYPTRGKNFPIFSECRKKLDQLAGGRLRWDKKRERWVFNQGKKKTFVNLMSEGIKKISILDILLSNRYMTPGSILFIDEPEAALHPKALTTLLEILFELSNEGIQIFMASHSYFVVKKLHILAVQNKQDIPIYSFGGETPGAGNLKEEIPDNPIVDESIQLYREEIDLD